MQNNSTNISLLWDKVCDYAKKTGRVAARPAVLLYYVMTDPNTPWLVVFSPTCRL